MSIPEKLIEIASFRKAAALLATFIAGAAGMVIYEQRNAIFVTVSGSPFALVAVAVSVVCIIVAAVAWLFVSQLDQRTGEHVKALQEQINSLREQIAREREDCDRQLREARDYCDKQIQLLLMRGK